MIPAQDVRLRVELSQGMRVYLRWEQEGQTVVEKTNLTLPSLHAIRNVAFVFTT